MFSLLDFENIKSQLDKTNQMDIENILKEMRKEGLDLAGWELVEIPADRVYCFFNKKQNEAFDYEFDKDKKFLPHYYKNKRETTVTKFATQTIRESIKEYAIQ